jgi:hypothetical protein
LANDENTAVNDLIARVGGGPLKPAVQKSSVQMSGVGIGNETLPASPRALAIGSAPTSAPHAMPVAAPFEGGGVFDDGAASSGIPAWSHEAQRRIDDGEHLIGTMRVSRKPRVPRAMGRVMPMVLVALGGVLVGAFIALRSPDKAPSPPAASATVPVVVAAGAPAPVVTPAVSPAVAPAVVTPVPATVTPAPVAVVTPAPAAVVTPAPAVVTPAPAAVVTPAPAVVTPAPAAVVTPVPAVVAPVPAVVAPAPVAVAPAPVVVAPPPAAVAAARPLAPGAATLIDVRIDSIPSGATVMLVDRGKTQLVGNTPIAAAIDPTRDYDLVFNYAGKPTKIEHLDPRITQHITVTLEASAPPSPPPAPRVEPAPVAAPRKPAEASIRREPRAEPAHGEGTLMISSKPPCEIVIDGKPTGLTTPQRAIALSAGRHKVTLVNGDKDIKRTFSVQITANATEKLIEDLMR